MMTIVRTGLAMIIVMGAVALVLTLLFAAPPASAAEHGDHGSMAGHHQGHQESAAPDQPPSQPQPHSGQCHCVSAMCAPVLGAMPPVLGAVRVAMPLRHDRPAAALARALADVGPAPEPPRA